MSQPQPNLMVAVFDRVVCVKIKGRADFTSSLDLKKLIAELRERGYERFIFELCECLMMDSTFLGVMSGIGLRFKAERNGNGGGPVLELFNPTPRIIETLENLGVAHLFKIELAAAAPEAKFEPAQREKASPTEITRTCLEAHRLLMGISPDNARKFKDVTEFLAEDLKRLESKKN